MKIEDLALSKILMQYLEELQNSMVKAKKELITLEATKDDYVPPLDDLIATEKKWVKYLESEIEIQERLLKEQEQ